MDDQRLLLIEDNKEELERLNISMQELKNRGVIQELITLNSIENIGNYLGDFKFAILIIDNYIAGKNSAFGLIENWHRQYPNSFSYSLIITGAQIDEEIVTKWNHLKNKCPLVFKGLFHRYGGYERDLVATIETLVSKKGNIDECILAESPISTLPWLFEHSLEILEQCKTPEGFESAKKVFGSYDVGASKNLKGYLQSALDNDGRSGWTTLETFFIDAQNKFNELADQVSQKQWGPGQSFDPDYVGLLRELRDSLFRLVDEGKKVGIS